MLKASYVARAGGGPRGGRRVAQRGERLPEASESWSDVTLHMGLFGCLAYPTWIGVSHD